MREAIAFTLFVVGALAGCGGGGRDSAADSALVQSPDSVAQDQTAHDATKIPADSPSTRLDSPPPPRPDNAAPARSDTTSGMVAFLGAEPSPQVTLLPKGGGKIALTGPNLAALERVNGAEIWVSGKITSGPGRPLAARRMQVERFVVRAVDGISVTDGTLTSDGDALVLTTVNGTRHRLVSPPPILRTHVGGRVWIAGNLAREPTTFGVIEH